MKKSEFIQEAYRKADAAGRVDDEMVIKFYLDMFLGMNMLPPSKKVTYSEAQAIIKCVNEPFIEYHKWEPED
jgi:hypothetical protein